MKVKNTVLATLFLSVSLASPVILADFPYEYEYEAQKEYREAEHEWMKHEQEYQRESMKRHQEMEREEYKHQEEMNREAYKHQEELAREDNPLLYRGVWAGTPFVRMCVQHLRLKDKYPDWQPAIGMPYEDVANIRPETKEMVDTWLKTYGDAKDVILGVESAGN